MDNGLETRLERLEVLARLNEGRISSLHTNIKGLKKQNLDQEAEMDRLGSQILQTTPQSEVVPSTAGSDATFYTAFEEGLDEAIATPLPASPTPPLPVAVTPWLSPLPSPRTHSADPFHSTPLYASSNAPNTGSTSTSPSSHFDSLASSRRDELDVNFDSSVSSTYFTDYANRHQSSTDPSRYSRKNSHITKAAEHSTHSTHSTSPTYATRASSPGSPPDASPSHSETSTSPRRRFDLQARPAASSSHRITRQPPTSPFSQRNLHTSDWATTSSSAFNLGLYYTVQASLSSLHNHTQAPTLHIPIPLLTLAALLYDALIRRNWRDPCTRSAVDGWLEAPMIRVVYKDKGTNRERMEVYMCVKGQRGEVFEIAMGVRAGMGELAEGLFGELVGRGWSEEEAEGAVEGWIERPMIRVDRR